jgi:hypothetical protein
VHQQGAGTGWFHVLEEGWAVLLRALAVGLDGRTRAVLLLAPAWRGNCAYLFVHTWVFGVAHAEIGHVFLD